MKIKDISGRRILASLGNYTVEAVIKFEDGTVSSASVPAGISAGKYEVRKVLADEGIREIGEIGKICQNQDWDQETLDKQISAHNFGGNSTLAVSAAHWKAAMTGSDPVREKFPKIMLLLFEGGKHGNENITFQEFMVIEDSVEQAIKDFRILREYLKENKIETTVGAEGGFSPRDLDNIKVIKIIKDIFPDKKIALDVAESFCQGQTLTESYDELVKNYPVVSLEDPYDDEDWTNWSNLTNLLGDKIMIVGDDLTVTNPERIKKAIELKAINAVVIKPNQIGTISGALEAVKTAREGNLKIVVSHRGEETNDDWIVDFALAVQADFVKFGGMCRGERIAKYNRLLLLQSGAQH